MNRQSQEFTTFDTYIEPKPPEIFKLNMDCFYEVFDYLSLRDIVSLCLTCKRLNSLSSYWFRENYSKTLLYARQNTIKTVWDGIDVSCFSQSIRNVQIHTNLCDNRDIHCYRYIQSNCTPFLTKLILSELKISVTTISGFHAVLNTIESLTLDRCEIADDFHENFLQFCSSIKSLRIIGKNWESTPMIIGSSNTWLHRCYPSLEHFLLFAHEGNDELKQFFEANPNIRQFSTGDLCFQDNLIKFSDLAFAKLDIFAFYFPSMGITDMDDSCRILNDLYDRGLFEKLHISVQTTNQGDFGHIATLKGLVKLRATLQNFQLNTRRQYERVKVDLSSLVSLEELVISSYNGVRDWTKLIRNLIWLRRIEMSQAHPHIVMQLVSSAVKLSVIIVHQLADDDSPTSNELCQSLDIEKLNRKRMDLIGAKKVRIYVNENIYIATKWAIGSMRFSHVEIKRIESHQSRRNF